MRASTIPYSPAEVDGADGVSLPAMLFVPFLVQDYRCFESDGRGDDLGLPVNGLRGLLPTELLAVQGVHDDLGRVEGADDAMLPTGERGELRALHEKPGVGRYAGGGAAVSLHVRGDDDNGDLAGVHPGLCLFVDGAGIFGKGFAAAVDKILNGVQGVFDFRLKLNDFHLVVAFSKWVVV